MSAKELARRVTTLEAQIVTPHDDDRAYVADIGGAKAHYWIDGQEVSAAEFIRSAPAEYTVDIGDDDAGGQAS